MRWRHQRNEQGISIDGYGYTRRCIENASEFRNGLLRGEVIVVDEKLVAFTFGGQIKPNIESIFRSRDCRPRLFAAAQLHVERARYPIFQ
jgi:hypothetical protein